jgi:hypothetical protein
VFKEDTTPENRAKRGDLKDGLFKARKLEGVKEKKDGLDGGLGNEEQVNGSIDTGASGGGGGDVVVAGGEGGDGDDNQEENHFAATTDDGDRMDVDL